MRQLQYCINSGDPLTLNDSELLQRANSFKNEQLVRVEATLIEQPVNPTFNESLVGAQVSIIDAINQSYEWECLLLSYGYKRQGKAYYHQSQEVTKLVRISH